VFGFPVGHQKENYALKHGINHRIEVIQLLLLYRKYKKVQDIRDKKVHCVFCLVQTFELVYVKTPPYLQKSDTSHCLSCWLYAIEKAQTASILCRSGAMV